VDNKSFRASVGASVLAAVLVILFVKPVLTWTWHVFVSGSYITIAYLTDSIYRNAALGQRNWVVTVLAILFIGTFGLVAGIRILKKCVPESALKSLTQIRNKKTKTKSVFVGIADSLAVVVTLYFLTVIFADLQLTTSFEQRLKALCPYTTQQQEEEIRAMWATMENRHDFEQIVNTMESIAKEKNVKLPKLLLE